MHKHLLNDLAELVNAQVLSQEAADGIRNYYDTKPSQSANRLVIVFGILGSLLVGMGITLIIAHNWDEFGKSSKLFFALLPLLVGQICCGFALIKKQSSSAWRESSAAFLVFAIAASISIVSQVYNIEGNMGSFLWIWMILCLPIIYVMRSSMASLLFLLGITWYACEISYFHYPRVISWWYWVFLLLALPYYIMLIRKNNNSNLFHFHSWVITISLIITLGMFTREAEQLMVIAYMSLFGLLVSIGQLNPFSKNKIISNAPLVLGSLGNISLLLALSFSWYWSELYHESLNSLASTIEVYVCLVIALLALLALGMLIKQKSLIDINAKSFAFLCVIILFFIGLRLPTFSHVTINVLLFAAGVLTIRDGSNQNRIGILNYGLLILTALIVCRFFDMDIPFVVRGLMFVFIGCGFFFCNFWMIKKRKSQASLS